VVILHGSAQSEINTTWRGARTPRGLYRLLRLGWRLPRLLALWRRARPAVARWIAVQTSVARENQREIGFRPDLLTIVPSGIDTDRFRPDAAPRAATRQRLGLAAEQSVLALVARLETEKRVDLALDAVALARATVPDLRLLVVGDGPAAGALRARARALGLGEAARFLGRVDHAELPAILAAVDGFLMPRLRLGATPPSLGEALATGLPVAAGAVGDPRGLITPGVRGWLAPYGDAAALAAAVVALLADAPGRREQGAAARRLAEARLSLAATAAATERVLIAAAGLGGC
jgi:phosphatidylinositol alpha-1,6-mannosyltransferase